LQIKKKFISLFIDTIYDKNIITKHLPYTKQELYDLLFKKIKKFKLDSKSDNAGSWDYEKIYINQKNNDTYIDFLETVFHEILHALTSSDSLCGIATQDEDAINTGINEGITEYISQKHIPTEIFISSYDSDNITIIGSGSYDMETCIVKELVAILGEDNILSDYFSNQFDLTNSSSEVTKYDYNNTSADVLSKICNYADIITNVQDENAKITAFTEAQLEIYKLMQQQIEYANIPGNEKELISIKNRFTKLMEVIPIYKNNQEIGLNWDILKEMLVANLMKSHIAPTNNKSIFDFKYNYISSHLEKDFNKISYQQISEDNSYIIFENNSIKEIILEDSLICTSIKLKELMEISNIYNIKQKNDLLNTLKTCSNFNLKKLQPLKKLQKRLATYLRRTHNFSENVDINISNQYIILSENNKTICFTYDKDFKLYPKDTTDKKTFIKDEIIQAEKSHSTLDNDRLISEIRGVAANQAKDHSRIHTSTIPRQNHNKNNFENEH